ncbi:hypothetical protein GBA52_029127 [Prunus armeniaca]|nr:hypothetical protein GBA52_029127 [Prunus armeniaca]
MAPTYDATKETKTMGKMDRWKKRNEEQSPTTVKQTWHKSGNCPQGTIPVRRIRKKELLRASSVKDHGRKKHSSTLSRHVSEFSDNKTVNLQRANHSDPVTSNWWVQYGERINVGYWPPELFVALSYHATSAEWGGEVYSSRVGTTPHTKNRYGQWTLC